MADDTNDTLTFYASEEAAQQRIDTCPDNFHAIVTARGDKNVRIVLQELGLC